jgi:DivIVA domain-containing protein
MTPDDIGRKTFTMARKGFDPIEVQGFLLAVATELREARAQALAMDRELQAARQEAERSRDLDPSQLTALLGEETARVLDAARSAADEMRAKAEASSSQLLSETIASTDELRSTTESRSAEMLADAEATSTRVRSEAATEADRMRQEAAELLEQRTTEAQAEVDRIRTEAEAEIERRTAEADAEIEAIRARGVELAAQSEADAAAELERARQEGRDMVAEAQRVRERMLGDLARRRKAFRQQIERLQAGRDRLMSAYDVVRQTLDVATEELVVALPQARLAAEAAALRAADENEPSLEDLEREAAGLPDVASPEPAEAAEPPAAEVDDGAEPAVAEEVEEAELAAEPDAPLAPSDASVEGRRSSSVKVIRHEEPTAEAEAEPEPEVAPAGAVEVSHADLPAPPGPPAPPVDESPASGGEGDGAEPEAEVSSLFARIREETAIVETTEGPVEVKVTDIELEEEIVVDEAELAELTALAAGQAEADAEVPAEPAVGELDADHQLLARRDEALVEIERNLGRRIKRELSDEQNELLDTVRRQKGVPTAADALPDPAEHVARYRTAALPSLVAASTAGADLLVDSGLELSSGAKAGSKAGDLAGELAADLVEPLRLRLERCFEETAGDAEELAERLRACYREWKGQRVDELVSRLALAAANRGLVDRLAEGSLVHWVVDDGSTPSPDCDDNALAGDIPRGEAFPTGHTTPPISNHCRCLVAPKRG